MIWLVCDAVLNIVLTVGLISGVLGVLFILYNIRKSNDDIL